MKHKIVITFVLMAAAISAQTVGEKLLAWTLSAQGYRLTEITGLTYDPATRKWIVPASPATHKYTFGFGFTTAAGPGETKVFVDSAYILYRVAPPTAPGNCGQEGTGALASDGTYIYICVPYTDPVAGTLLRWGRAPLEFTW